MAAELTTGKKGTLARPSVSIWLDSYDDVFSDFDSRPFSERALSDDFITEARKMAKEKPEGKIALKLHIPASKRNQEIETIIIKNLHSHFRHFTHTMQTEIDQVKRRGYVLSVIGFILMVTAAYIISISEKSFFFNVLRVVFEPAGWFMVWFGLEDIFYGSRKRKQELNFNSKMAHAEISFVSL